MDIRRIPGIVCLLGAHMARAQLLQPLPPYQPSRTEVLATYKDAARLDSLAKNAVFKNNIKANWNDGNKSFWYRNSLANNSAEYWHVDARTGAKTKLTDTSKLIATNDNGLLTGGIKSRWQRQPASDSLSPDKQWIATIKNGNIFIKAVKGGESVQCSFNGDTTKPYGQIQWSPDSKHLVVFHIFPVPEKPVYYVLSSVDSSMRGILRSHEYAQPGDPFTAYEMFTINMADKKLVKVNTELYDFLDYPWIHWRTNDNTTLFLKKPTAATSVSA